MNARYKMWFFVLLGVITLGGVVALFALDAQALKTRSGAPLQLVHTFDKSPTGFSIQYPDGWDYVIPFQGVFMMGPPTTLDNTEAGPTLTIQRTDPLTITGDLQNALSRFLESGPLAQGKDWKITKNISTTTIDGREALIVELEGRDVPNGPIFYTQIIATAADNTFVYLFISAVPKDRWAAYQATFEAMLKTATILE